MKARTEATRGGVANDDMVDAFDDAFDFVRAAVENPDVLDRLPERARLALRSIDVQGHPIQLAAARSIDAGVECWTAYITRWAIASNSPIFLRPVLDDRGFLHDRQAITAQFRETRETAEAALDALEGRLRTAFRAALGYDRVR